ncbi:alpha/beta hydrolase [Novosphingobium resinovorum]|uniref:alpha/beta fold hydrolase n=1 Tax=Novosphingobium resinovorum TaxID=158500 RepID=UPI002ED3BFAA|nr:alpha/beta hydrolase [Novosphingobium resinovorum]
MIAFTAHHVSHDNLRFPVIEAGSGDPLVLLHGGGSRAAHFMPLMRELAPHLRVIAYDQRGFAANLVPTGGAIDHPHWATDLIGVLDALGIDRAPVLGWSLGCSVAINAAAAFPERIAALVLVGAPDPARPVAVEALRRRQAEYAALDEDELARRARADLAAQLAPDFADDAAILDALVADRMASSLRAQVAVIDAYATRPDLLAAARRVRAPAALVTGAHDRISPPEAGAAMAAALGTGPLRIVPDAGHYIAAERPAALAQAVLQGLAALKPAMEQSA